MEFRYPGNGDEHDFALCLTHDVDVPKMKYRHIVIDGVRGFSNPIRELRKFMSSEQPWWCFEEIMEIEERHDVRSSFYFLNEKRILSDGKLFEIIGDNEKRFNVDAYTDLIKLHTFYDLYSEDFVTVMHELRDRGWEIGLHGSRDSYREKDRMEYELKELESLVGEEVVGNRQHLWNLDPPTSWRYHRDVGLRYDASLGSAEEYGFRHGYGAIQPFDDHFVVFPTAVMDFALLERDYSIDEMKSECLDLLREAKKEGAILTIDWHIRYFNEDDWPHYSQIYEFFYREGPGTRRLGRSAGSDVREALSGERFHRTMKV